MLRHKLALMAATALISGVLAVPAFADVNVLVNVHKDKTTDVSVSVDIHKNIDIHVNMVTNLDGLAEADALVNATSSHNFVNLGLVTEIDGEGPVNFLKRLASITGSLNSNTGALIQLNQDVGDNANQGNVVSASLVDVRNVVPATGPDPIFESAVAHAEAAVDQKSTDNTTWFETEPFPPGGQPITSNFHVRADIDDSVHDNTGVIMVNQNAGQNTNQHNVLSLAVGIDTAVALSEGDLGQESSGNDIFDSSTFKRDSITGSVNNNQGIVAVNQSVGHNNNQATVITVAATSAASALVPGPGL